MLYPMLFIAAVGKYFGVPTGAILPYFHARWYFQITDGHTFA